MPRARSAARSALGASILTATRRSSSSSSASQTELIAPASERLEQAVAPRDQVPGHAGDYRDRRERPARRSTKRSRSCSHACSRSTRKTCPSRPPPGRVLAEDARAVVDLPPFDSSAMDGYAVRAADTPGRLRVGRPVGRRAAARRTPIGAGRGRRRSRPARSCPDGADAVVPVEAASREGDVVRSSGVARRRARSSARRRCAQPATIVGRGGHACSARRRSARSPPPGVASVRVRAAAARRGARDRAASCARPASRSRPARSTSRTRALLAAQLAVGGRRASIVLAPGRRRRATRRATRSSAGSSRDVLDHLRRRLGRAARSRPRARSQELGARRCSGASPSSPGKPIAFAMRGDDARLRPAREPRLVARRLRALRPPGPARAAGRARAAAGVPARRARASTLPRNRRARRARRARVARRAGRRRARAADADRSRT